MPSLISACGGHLVACRLNVPATFGVRGVGGVRESCVIACLGHHFMPTACWSTEVDRHFTVPI